MSDRSFVHIVMGCRARHTAAAPRLTSQRYHVRKLQDLHVREAYSAHLASQSSLSTERMQHFSAADAFKPAELMQAAVTLFEDTLLCSAREVPG